MLLLALCFADPADVLFLRAARDEDDAGFFTVSLSRDLLRFLMTPVAIDNGLSTPCSFLNNPQLLHKDRPASSLRQSGVFCGNAGQRGLQPIHAYHGYSQWWNNCCTQAVLRRWLEWNWWWWPGPVAATSIKTENGYDPQNRLRCSFWLSSWLCWTLRDHH